MISHAVFYLLVMIYSVHSDRCFPNQRMDMKMSPFTTWSCKLKTIDTSHVDIAQKRAYCIKECLKAPSVECLYYKMASDMVCEHCVVVLGMVRQVQISTGELFSLLYE